MLLERPVCQLSEVDEAVEFVGELLGPLLGRLLLEQVGDLLGIVLDEDGRDSRGGRRRHDEQDPECSREPSSSLGGAIQHRIPPINCLRRLTNRSPSVTLSDEPATISFIRRWPGEFLGGALLVQAKRADSGRQFRSGHEVVVARLQILRLGLVVGFQRFDRILEVGAGRLD